MKLRKKIVSMSLSGILLLSQNVYASTAIPEPLQRQDNKVVFQDVPETYWAKESIEKIVGLGIAKGYPDGTFRPSATVTRAEFVSMVNQLMGYQEAKEKSAFKDVKQNAWYYKSVLIAEKQGYLAGFSDGTFRPNDKITKEQVCVIMTRITNLQELEGGPQPKDMISSWAKPYVLIMLSNRLVNLDAKGNFYSKENAKRDFVADVVAKFVVGEANFGESAKTKDERETSVSKEEREKEKSVSAELNLSGNKTELTKTDDKGTTLPSEKSNAEKPNVEKPPVEKKPEQKPESQSSDTIKPQEDKVVSSAREVSNTLKRTRVAFKTEKEKEIVDMIISNMDSYVQDPNHDYKSAEKLVREKYNELTQEEKEDLKYQIQLHNDTDALFELKDKLL